MIREIVLDTETTGLSPRDGHRIVELGCLELVNHIPSGETFHHYINPERDMPTSAFEIHGLSEEFLADKQKFGAIADQFIAFLGDSRLIIHNAPFDMGFLRAELSRLDAGLQIRNEIVDTLVLAQKKHPAGPNSLDALCRRYRVDNSGRTKHGALLDSELLAEVYLELIGGAQPNLSLIEAGARTGPVQNRAATSTRAKPLPSRLSDSDRTAHADLVAELGDQAIWRKYLSR
jgi:DNA polymerase-3 subunit epsilon